MVRVGEWEVNTDTNFLPWESIETIRGQFIESASISNMDDVINGNCLDVYVMCSRQKSTFNRKYGKFDDILSYLGGLFGICIAFISFFVMPFNAYRYELWVSQGSFSFKNSKRVREKDLNFLRYIKYSVYDWAKSLSFNLKWEDCQAIE